MSLPYELLDEIFSYLPPNDRESLRAYSLVAKSWVAPAQSRLFSSVIITEDNYQSWKDSVSPANKELLSNVRSLWYLTLLRIPSWNTPPIDDFFGYLSSFHRLQRLFLCSTSIKPGISKRLQVFSAFRHSLSSLILHTLILTWSSFVALVDYFPYVRDLEVSHPIWGIDYEQAPPLSRPLRGRLSINVCQHLALKIFTDRFSGLEVEYDELLILGEDGARSSARHYQRVIDTCGNSLKRLRLGLPALTGPLTLERCPRLCSLEFPSSYTTREQRLVISSITSINLRTVVFPLDADHDVSYILAGSDVRYYVDNAMRRLVDKLSTLGYKHTLELEFRCESVGLHLDFKDFLPKFRERGRVRISNTSSGEVLDLI